MELEYGSFDAHVQAVTAKAERERIIAALREPHLTWRSGQSCADWLEKNP